MKKIFVLLISFFMFVSCSGERAADTAGKCNIKITCESILDNMDKVNEDIKEFIPEEGIIVKEQTVDFYENETAFDLLLRICKDNKIKVQFEKSPGFDAKYITEINNIKSGDVGEMSGWLYYVNNESPSEAADKYVIKDGDMVEWVYTCEF